jgi:kinesin family protein C2/C3
MWIDLSRVGVGVESDLFRLLWEGEGRRAMGRTGSNLRSSRSHALWTIHLTSPRTGITSCIHLVDLAGRLTHSLLTYFLC